jgi:hypothetical protein
MMSILRSIEYKMERLVEGVFGRAFKANVQPVELAHKLAKEMGDHKKVSVSRVYVPNEYEIYLSPEDYENLHSFEESLKIELGNYLTAFARREGWTMVSAPRIDVYEDEELRLGEFGIAAKTVSGAGVEEPGALAPPGLAQTVMYSPAPAPAAPAPAQAVAPPPARLRSGQDVFDMHEPAVVIGRSKRCDVVLNDPNVSRQHAEVRWESGQWVLNDLDSTNGVKVNRRAVKHATLSDGDRILLGTSELQFECRP